MTEEDVNPIDSVSASPKRVRCDCCGGVFNAQQLTPTSQGSICDVCFDELILVDPCVLRSAEDRISQADRHFRRSVAGAK